MTDKYDVVIIGGGPAGLTAGLYAARDRFKTLILEKGLIGGNITNTEDVDNYPGYPEGITGFELTAKMHEQASKHGAGTLNANVASMEISSSMNSIHTTEGDINARAVIIASGTEWVKLGVEGEKELTGRGVSYCATCDGPLFQGKTVAVVGGGNAALYEALHLAKFASKVYLVHRRDAFRATMAMQEKVAQSKIIEPLMSAVVNKITGKSRVSSIELKNVKDDSTVQRSVDGVFIAVGFKPNTAYLGSQVSLDGAGSVIVNEKLQTNVPRIFAAGDVRTNSIRQVISAAGDGAHAAFYLREYLEG